jgi:hypothetical protein
MAEMTTQSGWALVIPAFISLGAAALILIGVLLTIRQKDRIDSREQWWKRVQWASDAVASSDDRRRFLGMSALTALITSAPAISSQDADLLQAIIDQVDLSSFADRQNGDGEE